MCLTGKSGNPTGHPTLPPVMKLEELHSSIKQIRKFFGSSKELSPPTQNTCFNSSWRRNSNALHTISKICNWNPQFVFSSVTWAKPSPTMALCKQKGWTESALQCFPDGQLCTAEQVPQIHSRCTTLPIHCTQLQCYTEGGLKFNFQAMHESQVSQSDCLCACPKAESPQFSTHHSFPNSYIKFLFGHSRSKLWFERYCSTILLCHKELILLSFMAGVSM